LSVVVLPESIRHPGQFEISGGLDSGSPFGRPE